MSQNLANIFENRALRIAFAVLVGFVAISSVCEVPSQAAFVKVYVLTGQSNALGPTDDPDETDYTPGSDPADAATRFYWHNVWSSLSEVIGTSDGQITTLQQQQGMYTHPTIWGPEFGFARKMYAEGEEDVMIVKACRSGGGNTNWSKAAGGQMYQLVVDTVNAATTQLTDAGDSFEIAGLLYLQGESDSEYEASIAGIRMASLVNNLREDLPNALNMHTVIGGIITDRTYSDLVRSQQSLLAAESDNINYFDNLDLINGGVYDGTHFNKPGKLIVGERYADAFLTPQIITKPTRPGQVEGGPVVAGGTAPYAWYRADVGLTPYDGDATKLAWWQDQSGNSRHIEAFGEPKISNNGIGEKQAITLDGMNDQILGAAAEWGEAEPGTVFAVWRRSPDSNNTGFVYDADLDQQRQFLAIRPDNETVETGGGEFIEPSTWINHYTTGLSDPGADQWFVTSVSSTTGMTDTLRINGEEVYNGDLLSGGMSGLRIGRFVLDRYYWNGDIAELIVFEGDLSTDERAQIERQLMHRWGVGSPPLAGDANYDGVVNDADAALLAANWLTRGDATWMMGDFNEDGDVDCTDVTIMAANRQIVQTVKVGENAAVPEPGTLVLLAGMAVLPYRRRKR